MAYEIVVGRDEKDREEFGLSGTVLLGKHFVTMGRTTSLSNPVFLDVVRSHVVFVCGKRGGGKSYTMGVITEGMADLSPEIKNNLAIVMLDTMGVYWTMKYPNKQDPELLEQWGLKAKALDVVIYTPTGFFKEYRKKGIPTDRPFAVRPSELTGNDWCITFEIHENSAIGVLITRVVNELREKSMNYSLDDIANAVLKDTHSDQTAKDATSNMFENAKSWGLFDVKGTELKDIIKGGQVTVLDVSCYATSGGSWAVKNLVIGLVAQKLFIERMIARKDEEYQSIHRSVHYFEESTEEENKKETPMVWMVIDEAHEFLPKEGKTTATDPLVTIMREGRQPGISLILATQQHGKIHTDVMTQSDVVIAHRITAKIDTDALGALMQSYMREGLDVELDKMPRTRGAALIFDDTNERLYPMQVRPRLTWHGGSAPTAIPPKKKKYFEI